MPLSPPTPIRVALTTQSCAQEEKGAKDELDEDCDWSDEEGDHDIDGVPLDLSKDPVLQAVRQRLEAMGGSTKAALDRCLSGSAKGRAPLSETLAQAALLLGISPDGSGLEVAKRSVLSGTGQPDATGGTSASGAGVAPLSSGASPWHLPA